MEVNTSSQEGAPHVAVALNEDDVAALSAYYYGHTIRGRRRDLMLKVTPLVVAVAWAVAVREDPTWGLKHPEKYALYLATGIPIITGLGWFSLWYMRPTLARLSVRLGARRRMLEPLTLWLDADALRLETGKGTGTVPWRAVLHVGHTEAHVFVLFAGPNGFVAPRRCFEDDAGFEAFAAAAEQYWKQRA